LSCTPNPKTSNMSVNADEVKKICAIYDWDGKGQLDMFYFGDIFYALGMNIMKKVCVKFGQVDVDGKKFCSYDEVVKLMNEAVKEPEHTGNYHDYVELCKLYDKNENGTIMIAELENFLSVLGDEIPKEDVQALLAELAPKEDEEGFIPYAPFLDKLCGKA
jgi:myosin light chain 6